MGYQLLPGLKVSSSPPSRSRSHPEPKTSYPLRHYRVEKTLQGRGDMGIHEDGFNEKEKKERAVREVLSAAHDFLKKEARVLGG